MKKNLTLNKDYSIKLKSQITKVLRPKYIYLPLKEGETILSQKEIKKEEKITETLISPISGSIIGTKYCMTESGALVKCLAILNDYKETFYKRNAALKNLNKVSWEKIIIDLQEYQYQDLANKLKQFNSEMTIVLNGIEEEPYVANEIFINKENTSIILETLDAIREKRKIKNIKIVVKTSDRENIEAYENLLGTYNDIELILVKDEYLISYPKFLKKYLNRKEECFFLKPSEVKKIYDAVKRHRYESEHLFTISGDGIANPQMIEAKIGTPIKEIIEEHFKIKKEKKISCYVNGLMRGKKLELENLIVTKDLNSILIMVEEDIKEKECINCGKCISVCPMGCNPKKTYETKKTQYSHQCIDCGLCSYICPSHINLRKSLTNDPTKDRPALCYEKENNYLYHFVLALIPLIVYGFYKNGILPFLNQDIKGLALLRPILFPIIGCLMGMFADYAAWWKSDDENIWTHAPLYGTLIAMTLPIRANLLLVAPILFFFLYGMRKIEKTKWKQSPLFLGKGLMTLLFVIIAGVTFANPSENAHNYLYSVLDIFFGRSVGGVCTTSIFWMILSYLFLFFDPFYKKEIPLYIIGSYFVLTFLSELFLPTGDLLKSLLNSSVFFGSIFIASEMKYSPYSDKGKRIYGISIGVLGYFFTRFYLPIEGIYLSILICGLTVPWLEKNLNNTSKREKILEKKDNFCRTFKIKKQN